MYVRVFGARGGAGAGGIVRLPRLVGPTVAKELVYTARTFSSDEARRWRLLNRCAWFGPRRVGLRAR